MKCLIYISFFLWLIPVSLPAQTHFDHRFGIQLYGGISLPQGKYNYQHSHSFYMGQAKNSPILGMKISKLFYEGFGLGLNTVALFTNLDEEAIHHRLNELYNVNDEYFLQADFKSRYTVIQVGVDAFKDFRISQIIIRPFVQLGFGYYNRESAHSTDKADIAIYLKKKNDNYFENHYINFENNEDVLEMFFYPAFGTDILIPVQKHWELTAGIQYSTGKMRYDYIHTTENLLGEKSESSLQGSQNINNLQLLLGLQWRI